MSDETKQEERRATGAVGNKPMRATPNPTATPAGNPADTKDGNPGMPAHTIEDPGWMPEEQGSALAHEREGVPESGSGEPMPDSAARTRRPA